MRTVRRLLLVLLCCLPIRAGLAAEVVVAVAASFLPPMTSIAAAFEDATGHRVRIVSGSTGGLYAQIVHGAPFDVFLAADDERPQRLAADGLGIENTRSTVAFGRLVLFSRDTALIEAMGLDALRSPNVRHIAIANPSVAPYGVAALQALEAMGLSESVAPRLVRGESVAQTYAMIATGNAEIGFVAMAQAIGGNGLGSYLLIPPTDYRPIRQDVIVLARARNKPAALALSDFFHGMQADAIVRAHGYTTDEP